MTEINIVRSIGEVDGIHRGAGISKCGKFRYFLSREWDWSDANADNLVYVMLNPSVADGLIDDPTVRRCMGFARRMNYPGMVVVNKYAIRSKTPKAIHFDFGNDPVGPDNLFWIQEVCTGRDVILAWGSSGPVRDLWERTVIDSIKARCKTLRCLGRTAGGAPRHPLYLPRDTEAVEWLQRAE